MLQAAAMEQMMADPSMGAGGGGYADPFAEVGSEAPPGYTMVFVPDAVLPAVMELVAQAESGGSALGASGMAPGAAMGAGAPLV